MIKAGILSDTHLTAITPQFRKLAQQAFADCDIIFHAGDITNAEVLEVFSGKTVHAVHGNMCDYNIFSLYPEKKIIEIGGYSIGLCHGAGSRHNIEERMWSFFPEADCIIFGHTHQPLCDKRGGVYFINPGCFQCTGRYGTPASYATLDISNSGLTASLHTISLK